MNERCTVSFTPEQASNEFAVVQTIEEDDTIRVFYNTTETRSVVRLSLDDEVIVRNETVPPGTHVAEVTTDRLSDSTELTLRATNPEGDPVASYQIVLTGCESD